MRDLSNVDCLTCREALSARLDGEAEPVPAEHTDEHLRGCAACQAWHDRAGSLSRTLRVRAAVEVPDLSGDILDGVPGPVRTRGWWPRLALAGVAVAQLGLALSQILHTPAAAAEPMASHLFNESTAWNLALGVGLFWPVFRPRAAAGLIPVLAGFLVAMFAYSTHDLIAGHAPLSREAGHGLLAAGLVLLVIIHYRCRDPRPRDADTLGTGTESRPPQHPASHDRVA